MQGLLVDLSPISIPTLQNTVINQNQWHPNIIFSLHTLFRTGSLSGDNVGNSPHLVYSPFCVSFFSQD